MAGLLGIGIAVLPRPLSLIGRKGRLTGERIGTHTREPHLCQALFSMLGRQDLLPTSTPCMVASSLLIPQTGKQIPERDTMFLRTELDVEDMGLQPDFPLQRTPSTPVGQKARGSLQQVVLLRAH